MSFCFILWFQKGSYSVRGLRVELNTDAQLYRVKHLPLVTTVGAVQQGDEYAVRLCWSPEV